MKKIISLFQRNYGGDRLVRDEITPGAEWVIAGEGIATRKWDGTACLIKDGKLYKRYDAKRGRTPPPGFIPAQMPDSVTFHHPGWVPVGGGPEDVWHREAVAKCTYRLVDGTYELCGPRVQANAENLEWHCLIPHDTVLLVNWPRDFNGIKRRLEVVDIEGIVWHRDNGDMVKIKAKDFGIERGKGGKS